MRWIITFHSPEKGHLDWSVVEEVLSPYKLVGQIPPLRAFVVESNQRPADHVAIKHIELDLDLQAHAVATYVLPDDPRIAEQWALERMSVYPTFALQQGAPSVSVAVIDTGVHEAHPEFIGRSIVGYQTTGAASWKTPSDFHGTAVTSCIGAATGNGIGISAPASGCTLIPIRTDLTISAVAEALSIAVAQGADVISMSIGTDVFSQTLHDSVEAAFAAGVVVILSAGNNGEGSGAVAYPIVPGQVLKVGSMNEQNQASSISSYGTAVDIYAPGESVLVATGASSYALMSGTSFATPYVAAVAALVLSEYPALTPTEVYGVLHSTAIDMNIGKFPNASGCVNALRAVLKARSLNPVNAGTTYPYVLFDPATSVGTHTDGKYAIEITETPPLATVGAYGGKCVIIQNSQYVYMGPEEKTGRNILCTPSVTVSGTYSTVVGGVGY